MVKIILEQGRLRIEVLGWHKMWACKSRLEVSLNCIKTARVDPEFARTASRGWKLPGTYLPGVLTAGTFFFKRQRTFWDVRNPAKAVVIELENHKYNRLVVEVEHPTIDAKKIQDAIYASAKILGAGC